MGAVDAGHDHGHHRHHHPIPFAYRLPMLYIEPLLALNGAAMLLLSPTTFLEALTPRYDDGAAAAAAASSHSSQLASPPSPSAPPSSLPIPPAADALAAVRVLTDQLAIMQIVFAFNLGVALRRTRDPAVWRTLCAGMLLSDVLHVAASARELSREGALGPGCWRPADWFNFFLLGGMGLVRLALVLGVGLGNAGGGGGGGGGVGVEADGRKQKRS